MGTTTRGYYIVWEVWLMKNPPIKPASLCFFRRLGALCGVFGGRGVDFIEENVLRRL